MLNRAIIALSDIYNASNQSHTIVNLRVNGVTRQGQQVEAMARIHRSGNILEKKGLS